MLKQKGELEVKILKGWVLPIAIGLLVGLLIKTFVFTVVRVDGISMFPNLQDKELVMEIHHAKIKRDSVIVFDAYGVDKRPDVAKNARYVKRVIALPGDKVEYKNDGTLYVNGKKESQSYISKKQQKQGTLNIQEAAGEEQGVALGTGKIITVPKNSYFVLGDNRAVSNDSRYYGFVPKDKVNGVAKVPFWNDKKDLINS